MKKKTLTIISVILGVILAVGAWFGTSYAFNGYARTIVDKIKGENKTSYINNELNIVDEGPALSAWDGASVGLEINFSTDLARKIKYNDNVKTGLLLVTPLKNVVSIDALQCLSGDVNQDWINVLTEKQIKFGQAESSESEISVKYDVNNNAIGYRECWHVSYDNERLLDERIFIAYVEYVDEEGNSTYEYSAPMNGAKTYAESSIVSAKYLGDYLSKATLGFACGDKYSASLKQELKNSVDMALDYYNGATEHVLDGTTITELALESETGTIEVGKTLEVKCSWKENINFNIYWTSSDMLNCPVENGVIKANVAGEYTISAVVAGKKITMTVNVVDEIVEEEIENEEVEEVA